MIEILREVAERRLLIGEENRNIQISSFLINKAIEKLNKERNEEKEGKLEQNEMANEFRYIINDREFVISNRAYRDDTNDQDVEEVLYEYACKSLIP